MRKRRSLLYHSIIFVLAQLAWLSLLGLWIYWYVYNYIVFEKVGDQVSPQVIYDITNVVPFVIGLVLLSGLSFTTSLVFRHLSIQLRLAKLYDNFISSVTHELKSPLSSIQLYLETLSERNVPPDMQKEFIDLMTTDVNRLNNLISSILEISALEQKKLAHNYQVQDAESTIKNLLKESAGQFRLPNDVIHISGSASCKIVTDAKTMRIVLDNLVDNAIKYSVGSVNIDVKLSCNLKKFIIEFSDSGIGIQTGELKKVFNKFHRIQHNNLPNVKGTGLGLYWTKEIIRNHGGKISVLSEGENKGTKFTVELPVYRASKKRFINKLLKRKQN